MPAMLDAQEVYFQYAREEAPEGVPDTADAAPPAVLRGVSLSVEKGSFVALLGHNGCGKSTLAKHFNAILLPEAGTVLVENMDTRGEDHIYDMLRYVLMERPIAPPKPAPEALLPDDPLDLLSFGKRK